MIQQDTLRALQVVGKHLAERLHVGDRDTQLEWWVLEGLVGKAKKLENNPKHSGAH